MTTAWNLWNLRLTIHHQRTAQKGSRILLLSAWAYSNALDARRRLLRGRMLPKGKTEKTTEGTTTEGRITEGQTTEQEITEGETREGAPAA